LAADGQGGWRINESSATELEKLGPSGVVNLWPLLNDPKVEVRRGAAFYLLGQFSPGSADQVAAFTHLLDDNDRSIRNLALNAAKQFRQADQIAAVPRLTAMLDPQREDKPENRTAVVRLFGSLKASAAEALSSLSATAASDPDAKVRAAALAAISQVAAPGGAVSPLAKGLSDSQPQVRVVAAARLRQLGPAAAAAAAELAAALGDADQSVADAAAEALLRIGPAAVDPLAAQLSSSSLPARKMALACLAKIGPPAGSATQQIEKCKQDADPQVRQLAEAALRRITGK
jgi:HEAT repeat protein